MDRMGMRTGEYRTLVGKPVGKRTPESLGIDGRTILEWILKRFFGRVWIRLMWLRISISGGLL